MLEMEFNSGKIDGVLVISLTKYLDERGYLIETFRKDTLPDGLLPLMSYVSCTEPGIARGPHEHREQTDIFAFIGPGNFQIYLWDNRVDSETYKNRMIVYGGEDNHISVVVPPGVVHGYRNITKTQRGFVFNYPDRLYAGWEKSEPVDEVRHELSEDMFYQDFIEL
jgi:dTDP-4-dehydrorhamnose 3,5-epimerase